MKRYTLAAFLGLGALLLVLGPPLRADGIDNFTYTEQLAGGNTLTITWSLPATSGTYDGNGVTIKGATLTYSLNGGTPYEKSTDSTLIFFNSTFGTVPSTFGGFELVDALNAQSSGYKGWLIQPTYTTSPGPQVYSVVGGIPTFNLGTYTYLTDIASGTNNPGTLIISTPEPSALLLLLTGMLAATLAFGFKKAIA